MDKSVVESLKLKGAITASMESMKIIIAHNCMNCCALCAMLGRVMMPIGTACCTACNTRFIISPSPSGLPFGLPFGREHFVVAALRWPFGLPFGREHFVVVERFVPATSASQHPRSARDQPMVQAECRERDCCARCAGPSGSRSVASTSWFCRCFYLADCLAATKN